MDAVVVAVDVDVDVTAVAVGISAVTVVLLGMTDDVRMTENGGEMEEKSGGKFNQYQICKSPYI